MGVLPVRLLTRSIPAAARLCLWSLLPATAPCLELTLTDRDGAPVSGAVVTWAGEPAPEPQAPSVAQRDKTFVPHILAVRAGTEVRFPNFDRTRHHIYSFSPAKRFEVKLYGAGEAPTVTFDKPGTVVLGCNIHDWMLGYIFVTDADAFAVSDADGRLRIPDEDGGASELVVWHPELADGTPQPLEVAGSGIAGASVTPVTLPLERRPPPVRIRDPLQDLFDRQSRK